MLTRISNFLWAAILDLFHSEHPELEKKMIVKKKVTLLVK